MLYQALGLSQKLKQPFFWVDEKVFPTVIDWRTSAPKDGMPVESTYSAEAVTALDTHRTPIQKQPEMLLCLVGISRRYYLRDDVYPTFVHDDDRDMDMFSLIRAPIPTKVKTGSRPRAAHEVPLLTTTANRVIEIEDPAATTDSSGVPSTIERSSLDFANEAGASDQGTMATEVPPPEDVPATSAPEAGQAEEVAATDPSAVTGSHKIGHDGVDANAPPKVLRRDHADPRPPGSTRRGKSLAAIELGMASTRLVPVPESAPADVCDPDPLSFADPRSRHPTDVAQSSQGTAAARDPESENASFASAVGSLESIYRPEWGVANGSMLDTPEACQDLVDHVAPSDLQGSNDRLSQQVATLQGQVSGEEKLKAAFEEFKRYEDSRVEQRCAEMDARLDALSIDFDEELYPHMLTAIAGHRWMIGHGLRLAVMKCGESLKLRQAFANVVSAGIAKGMSEGLRHGALKDMKYPLVDQLEGLKDAPMDVIMAALYLESDTVDDAPQWVRDLRPSSSQLTIPVYPEVRDPVSPWACKEEILLVDVIAANVSRAKNKKKCGYTDGYRLADALLPFSTACGTSNNLQLCTCTDVRDKAFCNIAARSRRSSNRFRFRRSSSSLFTTSTAAVRYVGISISVGLTASVPYVREKGVSPWLDLIIVRWAQRTKVDSYITYFAGTLRSLTIMDRENIVIGDGAKIGAGSVVLKDVPAKATVVGNSARLVGGKKNNVKENIVIGDGAKIGAGSVVLKDVPAKATVVGNPARLVGGKKNDVKVDTVPSFTMDHVQHDECSYPTPDRTFDLRNTPSANQEPQQINFAPPQLVYPNQPYYHQAYNNPPFAPPQQQSAFNPYGQPNMYGHYDYYSHHNVGGSSSQPTFGGSSSQPNVGSSSSQLNFHDGNEVKEVEEVRRPRPMGRDQAKRKMKAGSTSSFVVAELEKMMASEYIIASGPYNTQKKQEMSELLKIKNRKLELKAAELKIRCMENRQRDEASYETTTNEALKERLRQRLFGVNLQSGKVVVVGKKPKVLRRIRQEVQEEKEEEEEE
nr:serine acetyltransferase 1, chloroplastic-like [Tanacetum cinerariifolium]